MKIVMVLLTVLGLNLPAFCFGLEVDFDGKSKQSGKDSGFIDVGKIISANILDNYSSVIPNIPFRAENKATVRILVLSDSGEWIPAEPKLEKDNSYYQTKPGSEYIFQCSCTGDVTAPWSFSTTYSEQPWKKGATSPGHSHTAGIPSISYTSGAPVPNPFSANNLTPNVDNVIHVKAFDFATTIIWKTSFGGACNGQTATAITDIKEDVALSPMPAGADADGYLLSPVANNAAHPSIQNITADFGRSLLKLGTTWRTTCPASESLVYQRMSLPWGGVYDRDLNWKEPYYGHNKGVAVDISKKAILKGNRQGLINLMCNQGYKVYSEQDLTDDHYHVTLRAGGGIVNWPGATACCIVESGIYPSPAACLNLAQKDIEPVQDRAVCPYLPADQDIKSELQ